MTAHKTDVVVVGLGAMGSSTAWWLARRGVDVVRFEQFAPQHTRGSSHGGTRIFRFANYDPIYVRMAQAALPLWRELEADAGEALLDTTGAIDRGSAAATPPARSTPAIPHRPMRPPRRCRRVARRPSDSRPTRPRSDGPRF